MVDDDAVALVVQWASQHHNATVAGADRRTHCGAVVHALMDAGQLPVEHAASAEAVCRRGCDRGAKARAPQRLRSARGKDFCLELRFGLDLLERFGAGFDEFGRNGERAGAVMSGMDFDGAGQVACCTLREMHYDLQLRW